MALDGKGTDQGDCMNKDYSLTRDSGSFRDPSGYVFSNGREIFRTVNEISYEEFKKVFETGAIQEMVRRNIMICCEAVDPALVDLAMFRGARGEHPRMVLKHPKIPFVSYPYEWTFEQMKDAALAHLELQIGCLEYGVTLSDATPFNMQFFEGSFKHIDVLSLRPYIEDEVWAGYNQFCRLFLSPLLIEAWTGISFQPILRGRIDGLDLREVERILPKFRRWTSINAWLHISFQSRIMALVNSANPARHSNHKPSLPKSRYKALLFELHTWVSKLQSGRRSPSYWSTYATENSYSDQSRQSKINFIKTWAAGLVGGTIWDLGGNTGDFSKAALDGGVSLSVVLDTDVDSLKIAYAESKKGVSILPLLVDIADPSPRQGWNQCERAGLNERSRPDGVIALAVIHHLVIGRNIPLQEVVNWLVSTAPKGVIEFVPKTDPMVKNMLRERQDVFWDYDEAHFLAYLKEKVSFVDTIRLPGSERFLVTYSKSAADPDRVQ